MPPSADSLIAGPTLSADRIDILDALRGFAILGILLMNIPAFGMSTVAGWDPSVLNEYCTIDFKIWYVMAWIPEGTQRAMFSMLFGAGILLFTSRQEQKLPGVKSAEYFFRRQLWLIAFSLIDVYLFLWHGDILFDYACFGMMLYVFRNLPPKKLLLAAVLCCLLMMARENRDFYLEKRVITRGSQVAAIDTSTNKLTHQQQADLSAMQEFRDNSSHEKKVSKIQRSIDKITGTYQQVYDYRTNSYLDSLVHYVYLGAWDVFTFMFLGMAFFKMGILTGKAPIRVYWILCIGGLAVGLALGYLRLQQLINYQFNLFEYTRNTGLQYADISRCFRTLGIFGLLILLYRSGWFRWLFALMKPVGQMAFTNYLTQSIICLFVFTGLGWSMYGKLARHEVYYVVACIWILQIGWSHLWLRFFRFGPMEWCWRSLTYWKRQPLKK